MRSCDLCCGYEGTIAEIYDPFAKASLWVCQDCVDAQSDVMSAGPYEDLGKHLFGEDFTLLPSVEMVGKVFDLSDPRRKV